MRIALDHVVIHLSDWERSNAFYREVLGAELNVHGPGVNHGSLLELISSDS